MAPQEMKIWHPSVLSFELVMGVDQYFFVGCYIPPDDLGPLEHIKKAWRECLKVLNIGYIIACQL